MDPSQLPLQQLASTCREETEKYRRRETHADAFCYELIRRAVCDRSDGAWHAFLNQYRSLVLAWIHRHPAASLAGEEDDYWVNRTFERFWRAVPAERYCQFDSMPAVLGYLKMCAHSVLMDELRSRQAAPLQADGDPPETESSAAEDVVATAIAEQEKRELWQVISSELNDETERLLVYLSFVLDLRPREICERYPDCYPTVADVYRAKRNVLDRLRRNPRVIELIA